MATLIDFIENFVILFSPVIGQGTCATTQSLSPFALTSLVSFDHDADLVAI